MEAIALSFVFVVEGVVAESLEKDVAPPDDGARVIAVPSSGITKKSPIFHVSGM